jgi:hypothetical protein
MTASSSSEEAREALRREHQVELVSPEQEGVAAGELPAGVYGFTSSPALASPLFRTRRYLNYEVHHLPGGAVALVGFVTPEEATMLTAAQGGPVTLRVHPDAQGDATTIVCIPYDRIVQHRQYSVRTAGAITLQVVPAGRVVAG